MYGVENTVQEGAHEGVVVRHEKRRVDACRSRSIFNDFTLSVGRLQLDGRFHGSPRRLLYTLLISRSSPSTDSPGTSPSRPVSSRRARFPPRARTYFAFKFSMNVESQWMSALFVTSRTRTAHGQLPPSGALHCVRLGEERILRRDFERRFEVVHADMIVVCVLMVTSDTGALPRLLQAAFHAD